MLSAPAVAGIGSKFRREKRMRVIVSLAAIGLAASAATAAKAPQAISPYINALEQ